jgi:hypothetical protein
VLAINDASAPSVAVLAMIARWSRRRPLMHSNAVAWRARRSYTETLPRWSWQRESRSLPERPLARSRRLAQCARSERLGRRPPRSCLGRDSALTAAIGIAIPSLEKQASRRRCSTLVRPKQPSLLAKISPADHAATSRPSRALSDVLRRSRADSHVRGGPRGWVYERALYCSPHRTRVTDPRHLTHPR